MSSLVVDASAAVHLATVAKLPTGLHQFECLAPPLMWSEAVSALLGAAYRGAMPATRLGEAVERLEALPVTVAGGDAPHRRRAIDLALSLGWAKTYDAEYVALAQLHDCPLLTVDARLHRGVRRLVEVLTPSAI